MRVLVTGSRTWTDYSAISEQLWIGFNQCEYGEPFVLVHGHCPTGADALADEWARNLQDAGMSGVVIQRHPADWNKYGKRAGFLRNSEMVALGADICLAFIKDESKGASMTARIAEEAGIETRRFTL